MKKLFVLAMIFILVFMVGMVAYAGSELGEMLYGAEWAKGVDELKWGNAGTMGGDPSIHLVLNCFEDATGIKIIPIEIPGSQVPEYTRAMTLKEATFDTMWLAATRFFPDFAKQGWVIPLDDMVTEEMKSKWSPSTIEALSYDGKLMAIPHLNSVRILLVRKDLLKEAGLEVPKTWEDIVEAAKVLTIDKDGDGNIDQWGYIYSAGAGESAMETFSSFLYTAGGSLWNEDGTPAFNSPEGLKALQFMIDLVHKYKVSSPEVVDFREGNLGDLFIAGGAAMVEFDMSKDVVDSIAKWGKDAVGGVAPPHPADVKGPKYFAKPLGVCVSKFASHPEAAKHLALMFGTWNTAWLTGVVEGDTPAYIPIFDNWYFSEHFPFADQVKYIQVNGKTETHSFYSVIEEVIRVGIQSAIRQTRTPQEALDWMVEKMKKENVF